MVWFADQCSRTHTTVAHWEKAMRHKGTEQHKILYWIKSGPMQQWLTIFMHDYIHYWSLHLHIHIYIYISVCADILFYYWILTPSFLSRWFSPWISIGSPRYHTCYVYLTGVSCVCIQPPWTRLFAEKITQTSTEASASELDYNELLTTA